MMRARKAINELSEYMGSNGFSEIYVDSFDNDVVGVTRHNPVTHESIVLIAHTAFNGGMDMNCRRGVKNLKVEGVLREIVLEAGIVKKADTKFEKNNRVINGLQNFAVKMQENIPISRSQICKQINVDGPDCEIVFENLTPGNVIAFKFALNEPQRKATIAAQSITKSIGSLDRDEFAAICDRMSLLDFNTLLYRCDQEEREATGGQIGAYSLNGYGQMKYAGLQGVMSILAEIRPIDDLGNWLPDNLRQGDWLMDYIVARLVRNQGTREVGEWFRKAFEPIKQIPRFLIPKYFDALISKAYFMALSKMWEKMPAFVSDGSNFVKALALGSIQHTAVMPGAELPELSPDLAAPVPKVGEDGQVQAPTLAAGLPHFSTGYMRSWGRDTFISLRGSLILTGRFEEARYIILALASTLRHGLIPNLVTLDKGRKSR